MALIEPFITISQQTRRVVAAVNQQPEAAVVSVQEAARPIVSDIVRPVGRTVGVLTYAESASQGGLEGAGMNSGTSVVV